MMQTKWFLVLSALATLAAPVQAQNAAPSSHMVFNVSGDGDILINEVRVPKSGEAMYTYYEALGWSGLGAGYAGIQAHPKAHLFIFSIWDNKKHTAPIKAVHHGAGTETKKFGGEGTGLKSWNFKLGWKVDVWYTLVARNWDVGDHTHYAYFSRAGDTGLWTHLVTMDVAVPKARFRGSNDAFIEDWVNSGKNQRTTHLRGCWKRKADGTWIAATEGRYSVNSWDLKPKKRSFNFKEAWDGGIAKDKTGEFYYMISGGAETKPKNKNPSKHQIKRTETKPGYSKIKISKLSATSSEKSLSVAWENDKATLPQFAYELQVFSDRAGKGKALVSKSVSLAHGRTETLDVSSLSLSQKTYYLHLRCTDILDGVSEPKVIAVGKGAAN
jgi:hypothetical protein